MSRSVECPKCGADISDSYQGAEPDVGIMSVGWFCDECDLPVGEEDGPEPHDDDVAIFGTGSLESRGDRCPRCGGSTAMGYGLAGGGIGPYLYCEGRCGVISKSQDLDGTGLREELGQLRMFFAAMQALADHRSVKTQGGAPVRHAFMSAARLAGLMRVHPDNAASYDSQAHPLTAHGERARENGLFALNTNGWRIP